MQSLRAQSVDLSSVPGATGVPRTLTPLCTYRGTPRGRTGAPPGCIAACSGVDRSEKPPRGGLPRSADRYRAQGPSGHIPARETPPGHRTSRPTGEARCAGGGRGGFHQSLLSLCPHMHVRCHRGPRPPVRRPGFPESWKPGRGIQLRALVLFWASTFMRSATKAPQYQAGVVRAIRKSKVLNTLSIWTSACHRTNS